MSASVSVVLPWSTWAIIAMFRVSCCMMFGIKRKAPKGAFLVLLVLILYRKKGCKSRITLSLIDKSACFAIFDLAPSFGVENGRM